MTVYTFKGKKALFTEDTLKAMSAYELSQAVQDGLSAHTEQGEERVTLAGLKAILAPQKYAEVERQMQRPTKAIK